ncbi:ATP-binding protein [Plantactinospora mayteni]|uniref:histidine kinase n=1 Tax=Plantactinospora mayteni TaxID=566021 RepID=A0ABQ4F4D7_9ACTN|nr:HAMP domain-containing sensor histidine kinase [Plantactinospora mayteni]GIH01779.1 two-component sensor histidine kinase [Plantactinospora mayteni]
MTRPKPTIRVRLTLLYSGLFAAGGAILVVITYVLVAALPTLDSTSTRMPGGQIDRSSFQVPDWHEFEPQCREALATKDADPILRDKCVTAYQIWGAQSQRDTTLSHLVQYSITTLGVVVALAALAGWIVAGRVLRPVHQIAAAARAASERNLSARVGLTGPRDELRELADTFDEMLGRLQTAFDSQERFIANASHELRTPLAVMRATVDVVLAKPAPTQTELCGMAQEIREDVDHAEELIEALLTLARNERGLTIREDVDLATIAENVLDSVEPLDLRPHASLEPAITSGDPVLLERLVANLVDNALRYNIPGGDLWVSTSTVAGQPTVVVANTGPSIPPEAIGSLFEPFHRLNDRTAGDGFGLGLAIVASIAAMHHGAVAAHPGPDGGLRVVFTMASSTTPQLDQPFSEPAASALAHRTRD